MPISFLDIYGNLVTQMAVEGTALAHGNRFLTTQQANAIVYTHVSSNTSYVFGDEFAGDTGYCGGSIFRDIRARYGNQSVGLLPIGAYEPRWFMASQHVNPAEAVQIMKDVGARHALGIHWGTFRLTNESRDAPKQALAEARAQRGVPRRQFEAAEPGRVYEFKVA